MNPGKIPIDLLSNLLSMNPAEIPIYLLLNLVLYQLLRPHSPDLQQQTRDQFIPWIPPLSWGNSENDSLIEMEEPPPSLIEFPSPLLLLGTKSAVDQATLLPQASLPAGGLAPPIPYAEKREIATACHALESTANVGILGAQPGEERREQGVPLGATRVANGAGLPTAESWLCYWPSGCSDIQLSSQAGAHNSTTLTVELDDKALAPAFKAPRAP